MQHIEIQYIVHNLACNRSHKKQLEKFVGYHICDYFCTVISGLKLRLDNISKIVKLKKRSNKMKLKHFILLVGEMVIAPLTTSAQNNDNDDRPGVFHVPAHQSQVIFVFDENTCVSYAIFRYSFSKAEIIVEKDGGVVDEFVCYPIVGQQIPINLYDYGDGDYHLLVKVENMIISDCHLRLS